MRSWRRVVPVLLALLALLVGVLVWITGNDDPAPVAAPVTTTEPTTTTTTIAPTTLPPLDVDPTITTVATAKTPTVAVLTTPPSGTKLDERATKAGKTLGSLVAAYSPEREDAPAIPTIDAPVQGRRATPLGWEFDSPTPWGNRLTFVVTEDHGDWLRVKMPVRPNGAEGWIRAADVDTATIATRVEIDLSDRHLTAWEGTQKIIDTGVVVGKDSTPTPLGRLYLTDFDEKYRGSAYGPWVLALSGYSQALDEFSGGVPVIAMHGTNRPELVGSAASNGCIRMPDDAIQLLHDRLPFGTPVDIRA